ncbi:hypothetical protein [Nitrincola alkalilacustris]|uniref:hypothetical protein n=1 Tax=Nitrincola alkalilacustris TaxID=1571224 RepID=UPI00124E3613|nr:hypothetical protein [Nitrincola alkalilacustris]
MIKKQDVAAGPANRLLAFVIKIFVLLLIFSATWISYNQGVTGDLFYDDLSFLGPLEKIENRADAIQFIKDGNAGPLKRPIALLSFLPHADSWPESSITARKINVLIHLNNGFLLFLLAYQLLRLRNELSRDTAYWVAIMAAALWLVLPLLVSTSLITVQRWTGLSTLFGLVGLNIFTFGYFLQAEKARWAIFLQGAALGVFTLLAMFTKESGVLFPIYALVIDAVLLSHLKTKKWVRWLRSAGLWIGLLALLYYLSPLNYNWFSVNSFRGWSSFDRLQTQFVLLWHYLYIAFVPHIGFYGPFHDDVEIVTGWIPFISFLIFVTLTVLAFKHRKKNPWPLFALLWFFTGHLIESTIIHVELMFEHRNYLAIYGLCFALAVLVWQITGKLKRIAPVLLAVYTVIMWGALHATTSIWGNSLEAAENWVKHHPNSPRALMHLSSVYYDALGNESYSSYVLDRSVENCINCLDVRMQLFLYSCTSDDSPDDIQRRFNVLLEEAHQARLSLSLLDSFYPFQELLATQSCGFISDQDAYRLISLLLENPNYSSWHNQVHLSFHAAYFAKEQGDISLALEHLNTAQRLGPHVMPILQMQVHLLHQKGMEEAALQLIEERRLVRNRNRFMSDEALDDLEAMVKTEMINTGDS